MGLDTSNYCLGVGRSGDKIKGREVGAPGEGWHVGAVLVRAGSSSLFSETLPSTSNITAILHVLIAIGSSRIRTIEVDMLEG